MIPPLFGYCGFRMDVYGFLTNGTVSKRLYFSSVIKLYKYGPQAHLLPDNDDILL